MRLTAGNAVLGLVVLFVLMQLIVPSKTSPATDPAIALSTARPGHADAMAVFARSCGDCHSNDTVWPWYSRIAPISWLVAHDVNEGRSKFNISEFGTYDAKKQERKLEEACEQVKSGEMPMWIYTLQHRDARLRPGDVETICALAAAPVGQP